MWFDVRVALFQIKSGSSATFATAATNQALVAKVADVATLQDLKPKEREAYEERTAIIEFDGELTRVEAEALAMQDLQKGE